MVDVVVALLEVVLPHLRLGGLPFERPLYLVVLSDVAGVPNLVSGIWSSLSVPSRGSSSSVGSSPNELPARELNKGKSLSVLFKAEFGSNGAEVPVGEGEILFAGSGNTSS